MPTDHYQALGVTPDAGAGEIRAAYLRLMRANHPDHRPGDPVAASTARRANAAWDVLRDPTRRGAHDRALGHGAPRTRTGGGAAGAIWASPVSAPRSAYSRERADYRQAFSAACLRVGTAILVLGTAVLLALV